MGDATQLRLDLEAEIAAVDKWVESFPLVNARRALAELKRQRDEIDLAILDIEDKMAMHESFRPASAQNGAAAPATRATAVRNATGRPKTPRREAFYKILEADPERTFSLAEIRDRLIELNLMQDSKADRHSLQVMASKMYKRGEIDRPRDGHYKFLPPHSEAPETIGSDAEPQEPDRSIGVHS